MKRRVIALTWAITVGAVVMLVAGFVHPVFGYVAGVACAEAVYLRQMVWSARTPLASQVASGTE